MILTDLLRIYNHFVKASESFGAFDYLTLGGATLLWIGICYLITLIPTTNLLSKLNLQLASPLWDFLKEIANSIRYYLFPKTLEAVTILQERRINEEANEKETSLSEETTKAKGENQHLLSKF